MITLASDFGTPYPAAMKGVILGRTDARLVDVAHDFPRQDVRSAAFWLREVLPYFPPAVHLVVVDPGVGTDRAALAVRAGDHALVGPDNGVLLPAARALASPAVAGDASAPDAGIEVFEVEYDDAETESSTFHGRDVFAPAAADVHEAGTGSFESLDRIAPVDDYADLRFPAPDLDRDSGAAVGEVLVVDGFGNAVTNLPGDLLAGRDAVRVNGEHAPVARAYAALAPSERLVTVGSHGNVELAVNRGRGDEAFGVSVGDGVRVTW
ncbi:SAM-dependent chlorinase/fluorinase [Halorussus salilacus]|uniref:SAM hydrolase/SAM-dependent halogenase family protein n=1 Tax=Halorussus salilacus TaxID=2953750 RepID=UPI0020A1C686|nr:SAM-dependent chlorinase/fluorinase [Halorussus salilacus]USZ68957.1 SAM-dependent chlorinase/fluorinase [Halorussus salilacus]